MINEKAHSPRTVEDETPKGRLSTRPDREIDVVGLPAMMVAIFLQ